MIDKLTASAGNWSACSIVTPWLLNAACLFGPTSN
jgi:hypothetical protein